MVAKPSLRFLELLSLFPFGTYLPPQRQNLRHGRRNYRTRIPSPLRVFFFCNTSLLEVSISARTSVLTSFPLYPKAVSSFHYRARGFSPKSISSPPFRLFTLGIVSDFQHPSLEKDLFLAERRCNRATTFTS